MARIQTKSSVLALKIETVEGTPVLPTAGTDVIALQPDFSMEAAFDSLTNEEMRSSIGNAKPIQGSENPTASGSHYLRSSGVEGQAPNFDPLLKSFFGARTLAATQHDTVAASTVSTLKVDAGEGASYERGQGLLIKDAANGYKIRPVHSVTGDDLTLGFNLPTAPAAGVDLGKACLYKPVNTGHPTLTARHYLGNGGAVQMMTGARVTSLDIGVDAGDLVNMSYSLEGLAYYFNGVEITAATRYVDWSDDAGTHAAALAAAWYKSPKEIATALETAMNAATSETVTVTYSNTTGKYTVACTGALLSLLWNTGTNAANSIGTKLGFLVAANDTGALTYTSDNAINFGFEFTATYDGSDPYVAKNNEVLIGDAADYVAFNASSVKVSASNARAVQASISAETGRSGSLITGREVEVEVTALIEQYDVDKWDRYLNNTETRFQYAGGVKQAGNWIAGKCVLLYVPTAVVTSFSIDDEDGQAVVNFTLKAYVDGSGNGEFYLTTL